MGGKREEYKKDEEDPSSYIAPIPFDDYNDEEVWKALEGCGMKENVEGMPGLLQAEVAEYGENLSAGMRQLLVLGRALLKNCKILLLDEATSSVDYETDKEIQ